MGIVGPNAAGTLDGFVRHNARRFAPFNSGQKMMSGTGNRPLFVTVPDNVPIIAASGKMPGRGSALPIADDKARHPRGRFRGSALTPRPQTEPGQAVACQQAVFETHR